MIICAPMIVPGWSYKSCDSTSLVPNGRIKNPENVPLSSLTVFMALSFPIQQFFMESLLMSVKSSNVLNPSTQVHYGFSSDVAIGGLLNSIFITIQSMMSSGF